MTRDQTKEAKQRSEIARLTQALEKCAADKLDLIKQRDELQEALNRATWRK